MVRDAYVVSVSHTFQIDPCPLTTTSPKPVAAVPRLPAPLTTVAPVVVRPLIASK